PGVTPVPPRSARERAIRAAIFATFPYPRRLRLLSGPLRLAQRTGLDRFVQRSSLAARVAPEMAAALRIAPTRRHSLPPEPAALEPAALEPAGQAARAPVRHTMPMQRAATPVPASGHLPVQGERRAVVGMLTGCVQRVFFPEANAATARVLAAEGCEVVIPGGQGCCGALSLHSGRKQEAARFARRAIAVFERAGVDTIVVNSAGCGSAMKEYGLLLAQAGDDWADRAARTAAKVRDFSEFLAELTAGDGGSRAPRHPLPVRAAYHEACHLGQAQRIRKQPRDLLRAIPGLELAEVTGSAACCGSAGVYNLLQPEAAGELGARKAASVLATGADLVISANPGCSLQIATAMADTGHSDVPAVMHTAEVIDASVRGVSVAELIGSR
ncbi:MAG TPA: (Fe-S)-binding protein, partial [Streptosporangiaceae bacterium]|nr:(Fe-S)-binding protein [Streptosporangiaceae bacterium]